MEDIPFHCAFHAVAEGLEEFQVLLLVSGGGLLRHQYRHSHLVDKTELFFLGRFLLGLGFSLNFLFLHQSAVVDLLAEEPVECAFQDLNKALSAGVNYACLFEDRQQLRRVCKNLLRFLKDCSEEYFQVLFACVSEFS